MSPWRFRSPERLGNRRPEHELTEESSERSRRGWERLMEVDGEAGQRAVDSLRGITSDLGRDVVGFAFGDSWARPLPGATYGSFAAACHYKNGTFVAAASQDQCAKRSPQTGAAFNFWHPDLVTLHIWLWYPNPAGLYNGTNPYIQPFNRG
jgi:hypothetical protein